MLLAQQGQPGVRKLSTMVEKFTFGRWVLGGVALPLRQQRAVCRGAHC